MRFNKLTYLHTDEFDDIKEIKFAGNFKGEAKDVLTVELWVQDDNINTVIVDNVSNDVSHTTDEEEKFALGFARKIGLIQ